MVGWHHQLDGQEFERSPGDGEGQGGLACCSPRGRKESDTTERLSVISPSVFWPNAVSHRYFSRSPRSELFGGYILHFLVFPAQILPLDFSQKPVETHSALCPLQRAAGPAQPPPWRRQPEAVFAPCPQLLSVSPGCVRGRSLRSCPTLCDPTDCSPPGSSVPGILQARILEWVAMPSSRGSS